METTFEIFQKQMYVFAYLRQYRPADQRQYDIEITETDMRGTEDWIFIKEFSIPVEIPGGINLIDGQIETLEQEKQNAKIQYQLELNRLDDKIARYLCIEHQPEES